MSNMVCVFALPFHVNLRQIAANSRDTEYNKARSVIVQIKRHANKLNRTGVKHIEIYNTGKVCVKGCIRFYFSFKKKQLDQFSEEDCRRTSRGIGRFLQRSMNKLNVKISLQNYRIINTMASCRFPFGVRVEELAKNYRQASCELELMSGVTWKFERPKATLRIFATGSLVILGGKFIIIFILFFIDLATSSKDILQVVKQIYPIVEKFKCVPKDQKT